MTAQSKSEEHVSYGGKCSLFMLYWFLRSTNPINTVRMLRGDCYVVKRNGTTYKYLLICYCPILARGEKLHVRKTPVNSGMVKTQIHLQWHKHRIHGINRELIPHSFTPKISVELLVICTNVTDRGTSPQDSTQSLCFSKFYECEIAWWSWIVLNPVSHENTQHKQRRRKH